MEDNEAILLDSRISKVEVTSQFITDDIKDIKRSIRWLTRIVFSLNTVIITMLSKGFGVL